MSFLPLAIGFALCALAIYKYFIYPALLSPLSSFPTAHWSSAFSSSWILHIRYHSNENIAIYIAHKKHGDIVRLGPEEVSVNSLEGIKTIYGSGWDKGSWYQAFRNYGVPNMFSTKPGKPHSTRKRMMSHVYSKSYIQSSRTVAAQTHVILFERLLPIIYEASCAESTVDMYDVFHGVTMDFITAYLFGLCNSTNFLQNEADRKRFFVLFHSRKSYAFFSHEVPRLAVFLRKVPWMRLVPQWVDEYNESIEDIALSMCEKAKESSQSQDSAADDATVFGSLRCGILKENDLKENDDDGQISKILASEMLDHLAAGYETSAITLTYITYHLSRRPDLQTELREELIKGLDPPLIRPAQLPDAKQLDSLPLLHAIITETLRLNPPIPGSQPRHSPLNSTWRLPPNTRVSASAYSFHRREEAFPNPDVWDHTRWLGDDEQRRERSRHLWAFSSGARMCIGSHFAMNQLKFVTAAIYTNFTSQLNGGQNDLQQADGYTGGPKSAELAVRYKKVHHETRIDDDP